MEKHKSYGTFSKMTHFLSMFCEAGVVQHCTEVQTGVVQQCTEVQTDVVQQCTEIQAGVVQDGVSTVVQCCHSWTEFLKESNHSFL